jgi:hypothetical protein
MTNDACYVMVIENVYQKTQMTKQMRKRYIYIYAIGNCCDHRIFYCGRSGLLLSLGFALLLGVVFLCGRSGLLLLGLALLLGVSSSLAAVACSYTCFYFDTVDGEVTKFCQAK